jgi:hypothetical protein
MSHEHTPPQKPNDGFDELVAHMGPPTIESQRELFDDVRSRHFADWQDTGIMTKVVDEMHMAVGERAVVLTRILKDNGEGFPTEIHRFRVSYVDVIEIDPEYKNTRLSTKFIEVSRTKDSVHVPQPPFDGADALLVAYQMGELEDLRDRGDLPNLSPDLSGIADPSLGLAMAKDEGAPDE